MTSLLRYCLGFVILAATPAADASLASEGWKELKAVYEVPVKEELKAYARFPVVARTRVNQGIREYQYDLPKPLTGQAVSFSVQGSSDEGAHLRGDLGEMVCQQASCTVRLPDLRLDPQQVEAYLRAQNYNAQEMSARLEVAHVFATSDPAGFIHYEKSPY